MTAEQTVRIARTRAESRMVSRARIRRQVTGDPYQDESTGLDGSSWQSVYQDRPMRLRSGGARAVTIGGVELELQAAEAHFPADTTNLLDGDYVEVTAGEWAGTVWRIEEARKGDQQTARRVPVIETGRPSEWT